MSNQQVLQEFTNDLINTVKKAVRKKIRYNEIVGIFEAAKFALLVQAYNQMRHKSKRKQKK